MTLVSVATEILSILTLIGTAIIVLFVIDLFAYLIVRERLFDFLWKRIRKNAVLFAFIVSSIATLGSLFYSEIAGFTPCKLCWLQRIFMYPQSLLFLILLIKKSIKIKEVFLYSLIMSIIGALIAGIHYLYQIGVVSGIECDALGYSASCSQAFVLHYGYITIPMMSLIAFLLLIISNLLWKKN